MRHNSDNINDNKVIKPRKAAMRRDTAVAMDNTEITTRSRQIQQDAEKDKNKPTKTTQRKKEATDINETPTATTMMGRRRGQRGYN